MRATVVIPTYDARELLGETLASLERQTVEHDVVVVDNASTDGTAELLAERFPHVHAVRSERNLGFGKAVNLGVAAVATDVVVLVNNDVVCESVFLERLLEPLTDPSVGMVAGVLLQHDAPGLVDTAGIDVDRTLLSWDALWNRPVSELDQAPEPVGPCGGAAAYRTEAFRAAGGFDEAFFAYWEDVDLALRLRLAGHRCVRASGARALHRHGQTLGAASPAQRRLQAFGRGFVLGRYRKGGGALTRRFAHRSSSPPCLSARRSGGSGRCSRSARQAGCPRTSRTAAQRGAKRDARAPTTGTPGTRRCARG